MSSSSSDATTTGPIPVHAEPTTARDSSTSNLVACALSIGAVGLSSSAMPLLGPIAIAFALVALTLSILGVATGRRYLWAGWIGIVAGAIAVVLAGVVTAGMPNSPLV
ncbi:hypothetical protein [Microbacterium oleivorans]|uniref:Uncharacterized protein n=1 Tax=Microbacterium oleivorans TaxID=273677 RepID=A0A4R5YGV3_9MICO|nr:hypothetical protein [Microbacterium oleivorans]TDL44055.1 hypothetical protein E2R54_12880 [Microbacterium oleivorans]